MDEDTIEALKDYQKAVADLGLLVLEVHRDIKKASDKLYDAATDIGKILEDVDKYARGEGIGNKINLTKHHG